MRCTIRNVFANSFLALLVSAIIMFMVFAVRTILDPMYKNPELIETSKQVFSIFLWPYNLIESKFIGLYPDFSHKFHILWSPVGAFLTILYIALIGNLVFMIVSLYFCKKSQS